MAASSFGRHARNAVVAALGIGMIFLGGCGAPQQDGDNTATGETDGAISDAILDPGEMGTLTVDNPGFELPESATSEAGTAIAAPDRFAGADGAIWVPTHATCTSGALGVEIESTYEYDAAGNLMSYDKVNKFNGANNRTEKYSYEGHGYLLHIGKLYEGLNQSQNPDGYDTKTVEVSDDGRLARSSFEDGAQGAQSTISYEYGDDGHLVKATREFSDMNTKTTTVYDFDEHGSIVAINESSQFRDETPQDYRVTIAYEYDGEGRATTSHQEGVSLANGEPASEPDVVDGTYSYDENGNVSEVTLSYTGWDMTTQTAVQTTDVTKYEYQSIAAPSDGAKLYLYEQTFQQESSSISLR